jgi:hypothetical protein
MTQQARDDTTLTGPGNQELIAAARIMLQRMGVEPADLMLSHGTGPRCPRSTSTSPQVAAAVSSGTAATYGSYWKRILAKWGARSLLDPSPTEVEQFREEIKANAIVRRTSRGGRGTAENFIAALRCVYKHAIKDGLITRGEPGHQSHQTTTTGLHPARTVQRPDEPD